MGYETKKVLIKNQLEILLKPSEIKLNEVVLLGKKNTKEIEIGKSKNSFSQAFRLAKNRCKIFSLQTKI